MFEKEEMMVSVAVAEKKIREEKRKAEDTLKDVSKYYQRIINEMKLKSTQKGALFLHQHRFSFGEQTPFHSEGIVLFTGDEVTFKSGEKGVVIQESDEYYVYTNDGKARINHSSQKTCGFVAMINEERLKITKHFNLYEDGEEVAKGRKGGEGFIVQI